MDAEFLRTTVGDRLAKAVAAAAESGADDKVEYIADWLLNQVSVEEAGVPLPAASAEDALIECCELQVANERGLHFSTNIHQLFDDGSLGVLAVEKLVDPSLRHRHRLQLVY